MNERIKELAIEAGMIVGEANGFDRTRLMPREEKFAELLVKECMEQVWYTREDGINGNVSEVIKDRIKQHFGVE